MKLRKHLNRLGGSVAILIGLLLCMELALRLIGHEPVEVPIGPRHQYRADPDLGIALRPGFRGRHAHPEFDVAVEIDERGFRDVPLDDSGDAPRVVVLGDSLPFGYGVEAEQSFPELVQASLGVDVVNTGTSSYGPNQQLALLRRIGPELEPDLVLSTLFTGNDLSDLTNPAMTVRGGLVFSRDFAAGIDASLLKTIAVEHSQLLLALTVAWLEVKNGIKLGRPLDGLEPAGPDFVGAPVALEQTVLRPADTSADVQPADWVALEHVLGLMREAAAPAELMVVYMPAWQEVDAGYWEALVEKHGIDAERHDPGLPFARAQELCEGLGIRLIDPRAELIRSEGARAFYFPRNGHLTAAGHERVARAVAPVVEQRLAERGGD